ncbi:hypothetical protein [Phytoactinopolyspora halotolerans]|uniref:DUF308 domain-containing protein n=1 Tax=Phytoactinopolyspora halotolerans TaxID=1981512 RepID=A0A6L9SB80_9ACTN|nr:hypothetical protein [Phytoactinopolyspora halotolerans]NEE01801.1 hypothetical protein [Phytoactinopolyspora halotolerans]
MSTGRDDEQAWAELVDTFHAEPEPDDGTRRWPAAEDIDPDDSPYGDADPYGSGPHDSDAYDSDPYDSDAYDSDPYSADRSSSSGGGSDTLEHPSWSGRGADASRADATGSTRHMPASGNADPGDPGSGDGDSGDDHFVPPIPPPIPRGDRITRWAWTGLLAPPPALLLATIAGWSPPDEFMVLLVGGFVAGFVTLVARMRGRNPHDPDNGAVV